MRTLKEEITYSKMMGLHRNVVILTTMLAWFGDKTFYVVVRGFPAGWHAEVKDDVLGTVIVRAPNGYTAVTTAVDSNPSNVLRMLALALAEK